MRLITTQTANWQRLLSLLKRKPAVTVLAPQSPPSWVRIQIGITYTAITARSGTTLGSGQVQFKKQDPDNLTQLIDDSAFVDPVTVYNWGIDGCSSNTYVVIGEDIYGVLWYLFPECAS